MTLDFLDKKEQVALMLENLYSSFGYGKYRMNKFEEYSFYMENEKFLSDTRVIIFNSPSGKLMALKPDITMSIVKNCLKSSATNHKMYYNESVFRIPKGDSDFKEIQQIGVEYIGKVDTYQTLETLNLAVKSLEIISDKYMLSLSNMDLISHIFEDMKLTLSQKNTVIDYMKQKNVHDLRKYFEIEKIENYELLIGLLGLNPNIKEALVELKVLLNGKYEKEYSEIAEILEKLPCIVSNEKVQLDFSHIVSTEYYNGLVFLGYIDGLAVPAIAGGRYDRLAEKMGLEDKEAFGFAVYLSSANKLIKNEEHEVVDLTYDDKADVVELINRANAMYADGKAFCVSK